MGDLLETRCATCCTPLLVVGAAQATARTLRCWACLLRCDALRGQTTHVMYLA